MGTVISYTSKIVATNVEIQFKYILSFHICCQSLEVPFYFLKKGCSSTFVHLMNVQVISVW